MLWEEGRRKLLMLCQGLWMLAVEGGRLPGRATYSMSRVPTVGNLVWATL